MRSMLLIFGFLVYSGSINRCSVKGTHVMLKFVRRLLWRLLLPHNALSNFEKNCSLKSFPGLLLPRKPRD
jgi:hypothetical protein